MVDPKAKNRLRPPLMFAFREAHRSKDAKVHLDLRDAGGERAFITCFTSVCEAYG
jgi:type VI secretion system protein ImpF